MENRAHALAAGVFMLLFGLAVLATVMWFGGKKETMREVVLVTHQNVTGLMPEAQVRYRGIPVGKVLDIRIDPADMRNILIRIEVRPDVPLTRGTMARLALQGVTSLPHVLLEDSGKDLKLLPDKINGKPPYIPMQPSLLEEIGSTGVDVLREVRGFVHDAKTFTSPENQQSFTAILNHLEDSTRTLKPTLQHLDTNLVQLQRLLSAQNVEKLSQGLQESGPLLSDTRQLVGRLQRVTEKLDQTLGDPASQGVTTLGPRLHGLSDELGQTNQQLQRVLKQLEARPQSLLLGATPPPPGPGEAGFEANNPAGTEVGGMQ
jgi:phospholipid/cholesterol/gamma-HCH transport system substrate-binding protein